MSLEHVEDGWYAVAWSAEIERSTRLVRRILDRDLLLFRQPDGEVSIFANRCPHRFAPLETGVQADGTVHCPYHGLRFDRAGACAYNPHGPIPLAAKLTGFAVAERGGLVFMWAGEPERADPALLPDLSEFDDRPGQRRVGGTIEIEAAAELILDNLLDLSHVEFLHPHLAYAGAAEARRSDVVVGARSVTMTSMMKDQPVTALYKSFWPDAPDVGDKWSEIIWEAPGSALLWSGWVPQGGKTKVDGRTLMSHHLITPIDARRSYYFWGSARRFLPDDPAVDQIVRSAIELAFCDQDKPMIEAQQRNLRGGSIYEEAPVLLTTDRATVGRKRVMSRLIESERARRAATLQQRGVATTAAGS